jgi:hypothetical protein
MVRDTGEGVDCNFLCSCHVYDFIACSNREISRKVVVEELVALEVVGVSFWWVERCPLREGARSDPCLFANPASPPPHAWERLSAASSRLHSPPPPISRNTRISYTTGTMSQTVVQTIHRDPALLYVETAQTDVWRTDDSTAGGSCSPLRW